MEIMSFVLSKVDLAIHLQTLQMLIFFNTVANTPVDAAGHYDFVVCVHKAINQDAIAKSLAPVIDDTTTIVLIQNGVGNEDPFRAQFPNCSILSCVVCPQPRHPSYENSG
jgi:ketopantoate reductase